jgi:Zn-dependent M28 family amino/carboxypeptidase
MADGSWQQAFSLIGVNTAQPPSWTFVRAGQRLVLDQGSDFIVSNGTQTARAAIVDAEVVFVGYGIQAPEYGWDDFKGADVAGKVLLMLNNDPDWDPALFEGATRLYYGRWSYKYEIAARLGAAGAIIIHTPPSAGYPWQVVRTSWSGTQFHLPAGDRDALAIAAWISEQAARELLSLADLDFEALGAAARSRDFAPVSLGLRTSIALDSALSEVATANVLGLLDGSDPDLADEAVVFMAHHDHLGVAVPDSQRGPDQDLIYNGARDNASGVGIVTAIAHAVGALSTPPRRSVLVAYVGAEEQGLLGSEYFARHPVIPAGKIAAAVNFDSANIWGRTSDISFIGLGKSDLDEVARAVGGFQDREVTADRFPDRGYYYRSDQFSLAKIGIPAMYLKSGIEFLDRPAGWGTEQIEAYEREHYHQPSDELTAAWDFSGLVDDARFGYLAGILVANEEHFPAWRAGDEFEAARREAVDAAR